jgi:hypothetical protein
MIDFNSRKLTVLAFIFVFFCLYQAGYFKQIPKTPTVYSEQEKRDFISKSRYKINFDPQKPKEEMSYWERLLGFYLDKKNLLPKPLFHNGDTLKIRLEETTEGALSQKELVVTLGEHQVADYIESQLYYLNVGEKKSYSTYDKASKTTKFFTIEILEIQEQ